MVADNGREGEYEFCGTAAKNGLRRRSGAVLTW
jgi:hypothetical protein